MSSAHYLLPNHPDLTSIDPLGFCSTSEAEINHFILIKQVFQELMVQDGASPPLYNATPRGLATTICSKIGDIAYSMHGDSSIDAEGLLSFLVELEASSTGTIQQFTLGLMTAALALNDRFPNGTLPQLTSEQSFVTLNAAETDCLLAHLFLGTLQIPVGNEWGRPGFTQLFSATTSSWATVSGYLSTLVEHFASGGYGASTKDRVFSFMLSDARAMPDVDKSQLPAVRSSVSVVNQPFEPSPARSGHAYDWPEYVLVAAHSQPGPGPGGTQEERLVGQSPALAIVSLLKPLLGSDEVVITSPFPVHASWQGHGRHARMVDQYNRPEERPRRCYIVADALELDVESCEEGQLADLQAGNVEREVKKLFAAFSGVKQASSRQNMTGNMADEEVRIQMPPWGCGAFGGSLEIKVQCMMMAAALADIDEQNMELIVTPDRASELDGVPKEIMTVAQMYDRLNRR